MKLSDLFGSFIFYSYICIVIRNKKRIPQSQNRLYIETYDNLKALITSVST